MIEIEVPAGVRVHLDDRLWPKSDPLSKPKTIEIRCLAGAATLVGTAVTVSGRSRLSFLARRQLPRPAWAPLSR